MICNIIKFRFACGVEIGEKFIVTGGMNFTNWYHGKNFTKSSGITTVTEYSQSGSFQYLTPMNEERWSNACSTFVTDSGDTVSY